MTQKLETYTTLTGESLSYPKPKAALAAFLARVFDSANDPSVTESELTRLIYGKENPLLDQSIFAHHGAVTRAVFNDPVYHVMLDLLGRKRIQCGTLNVEKAAAHYTMTVTEAAAQLGVHPSAVRQAIHAKKLSAWKKGGLWLLDPRSVDGYRVSRRGPRATASIADTGLHSG